MVGKITPVYIPKPVGILGWDGTDFYALKVDSTGRLRVRGEDQLFSVKASMVDSSSGTPSAANGFRASTAVPANTIWVVTLISQVDNNTANTAHAANLWRGGVSYNIDHFLAAFAVAQRSTLVCQLLLETGDQIRGYFIGSLATDTCVLTLHGYSMTKEI